MPGAVNDTYAAVLLLQFVEVMKFSLSFKRTQRGIPFFFKEKKGPDLLPMLIQTLDKGITDDVDGLNGRSAGKHAGAD